MELWFTEETTKDVRFGMRIKRHLASIQSPFQKIDIFDTEEFGRALTLDGCLMVTEKDEFIYHDMITHVPMAVNPNIKKVLIIGAGDGGVIRELCRYDSVEQMDVVEIDEEVVRVCKEFLPTISCCFDDKRVTLYYEDGMKFIRTKEGEYDLIIVDSTDPFGPGEGLFTKEFYGNCEKALNETGILVNQLESSFFEQYANATKRAYTRIKDLFPIHKVYQAQIPTYPSGNWLFGFASKKFDPILDVKAEEWKSLGLNTKYYNLELHKGCFALPSYIKELLGHEIK